MTTTQDEDLGQVRRTGETVEIVFQRRYARPIDRVWAALTVPERIADWFAAVETLDLREGGAIHLHFPEVNFRIQGRITVLEPPRRLTWTWPRDDGSQSSVSFELAPDGTGCRLTLTESGLALKEGAGNAAGWHAHLAGLQDAVDGVRTPWAKVIEREKAVNAAYKARSPG